MMLRPAPRNKIAGAKITKWVVGESCMIFCKVTGMLSSGVAPPESSSRTKKTDIASGANCGIELASVARKIPSDVTANR